MDTLKPCFVIMFPCLLLLSTSLVQGSPKSNETDHAALIEFKSRISNDPNRIFSLWNDTVDFCRWPGITCSRHPPRVTKLELPASRFMGSLSPSIGNLSFLKIIDIENNSFTGEIPPEIGNLRRLTALRLDNNSFSGQLPENISGCSNLREIRLRRSKLVGEIPYGVAALLELRIFQISGNNFTGKFPDFFGNFSSLGLISGRYNNFGGTIPASLGRLQKLKWIGLFSNLFSGTIPTSIFNITSLVYLDFAENQLEGGLPLDLGIALPNLLTLGLGSNHLTGFIPPAIGNATNLQRLQIAKNNFSGSVPDLESLNQLRVLSISGNHLGSGTSGNLNFIKSLNSTELKVLAFHENNFGGMLPQSIGNLSAHLNILVFAFNRLTGTIPTSIGNLRNLETLFIDANPLTGSLPGEIGNLHLLKHLQAQYNGFSGEIPSSLGNLTMLTVLSLRGNELRGTIPSSLGYCQNLIALDLSRNNLSGTIPTKVLNLSSLTVGMDLSNNELSGALPDEIGDLNKMVIFYVQENRLSGRVPNSLSRCTCLTELYMGSNLFEGNISAFLSPLKGLQYLDMSRNNFSGEIPRFLENFHLTYLNLSFNHFEGEVPNQGIFLNASAVSVMGNDKLCGGIPALNLSRCPISKSRRKRKHLSIVIIATVSGTALLFILIPLMALYIHMRYRRRNVKPQLGLVLEGPFPQISYKDILRATNGLHQNNLIGTGSFGSVYKGTLGDSENMVAIKVLNLETRTASKSFIAECEVLKNIRHRNLVKIFTACSTIDFKGNEFKALVYEYMENGSLEECLHPNVSEEDGERGTLSLVHRLSIAIDIASAVEYLHHDCESPIIHCDLKPSNVLLDAETTAHVGDFGLARILSTEEVILQTSSLGVRGTIGYSPPEYGMGSQLSREGDVYSYGILLLEMFTGKRPTDNIFGDAWNIQSYCEAALPTRVMEIADPSLFSNELGERLSVCAPRRVRECLAKVFEVGIGCCRESPGERIDIREAVAKLRSIKALVL